ncbi:nucleotidyltransferase family protein [Gimibacter soli]|uniref:Nucleotidyltransferase family protein n=1 Tax=Gimibacter soli TaxID=3024400 RepID=A0AAE9XPP6_9PROT|nr:nucleotidyltransferase family protein [Gimibacter soli]WCL54938.1 nucleotidyltransferase family protein [Gimibacter soli]
MSKNGTVTALVLAASRRGAEDAVAKLQGVSHKCLISLDGKVMLERVVETLIAAQSVGRIFVSIESRELLESVPQLKAWLDEGRIAFVPSADNLFASVTTGVAVISNPYPLVITTGDNPLHTPDMIDHFCAELARDPADVGVAMTPAADILAAYPEGKRAFHELKDGGWSSCNLYALNSVRALGAAKVFEGGGQFGKRPERIRKAFGLSFMLLYRFRLATIHGLAKLLSHRWHATVKVVRMPYADAPIDVDNPGDVKLAEKILTARRMAAE